MSPNSKLPPSNINRSKQAIKPSDFFDPFAVKQRGSNFPELEDVFHNGGNLLDQDLSMTSTASSANLSIGARAALNEHLRHVARYGLDNSQHVPEEPEDPNAINPLDIEWDRIVDGNVSMISANNSYEGPRLERVLAGNHRGQESVEVFAETSSDYFNSSRVLLLSTPEKNKEISRHVTARGEEPDFYSSTETDSDDCESEGSPQQSRNLFDISLTPDDSNEVDPQNNNSFVSLGGVDVSRISATGSEVMGRSILSPPDTSLQEARDASQNDSSCFFSPSVCSLDQSSKKTESSSRKQRTNRNPYQSPPCFPPSASSLDQSSKVKETSSRKQITTRIRTPYQSPPKFFSKTQPPSSTGKENGAKTLERSLGSLMLSPIDKKSSGKGNKRRESLHSRKPLHAISPSPPLHHPSYHVSPSKKEDLRSTKGSSFSSSTKSNVKKLDGGSLLLSPIDKKSSGKGSKRHESLHRRKPLHAFYPTPPPHHGPSSYVPSTNTRELSSTQESSFSSSIDTSNSSHHSRFSRLQEARKSLSTSKSGSNHSRSSMNSTSMNSESSHKKQLPRSLPSHSNHSRRSMNSTSVNIESSHKKQLPRSLSSHSNRRIFRTVVPARVFIEEKPTDFFPEERDSFSPYRYSSGMDSAERAARIQAAATNAANHIRSTW